MRHIRDNSCRLVVKNPKHSAFNLSTLTFILHSLHMPSPEKWKALEARMIKLGILPSDLIEKFIRGSGSGGQKINKTASCVYLKHIPSGIEVKCQAQRSRELNRFIARKELCETFQENILGIQSARQKARDKIRRQKRRRSRRQKNKILDGKSKQGEKKQLRQKPTQND